MPVRSHGTATCLGARTAFVAPLEHAANASAQAQLPLSPVLPGLARRIETTGATEPADAPPAVAAPAPELGGVVQYAEAEPPVLPFAANTNSAVYVPLLLDAAGMLSAGARRAWHTHPTISAGGGPPLSTHCSPGHSCPCPSSRMPSSTLAKHSTPRRCAFPRRSAVSGSVPRCGTRKSLR